MQRVLHSFGAPLLWPFLFGVAGWYYGWVALGHPHAWQVLPFIGLMVGLLLAVAHWVVLMALWYQRRHRERDT